MDRDEVEVHNTRKNERGQYPAILTEQTWSIKDLLYGFWGNFACGIQRVVPSGQDGSFLPARVANHSARFGLLVYTTQVNSTFCVSSELICQVLFTSEQPKKNKMAFVGINVTNKVTLWAPSYSACVVYTKTIIHLTFLHSFSFSPRRRFVF